MLECKANINYLDFGGRDISHYAVAGGNFEIIRIIERINPELKIIDLIEIAIQFHHLHIFNWLYNLLAVSQDNDNFEIIKSCLINTAAYSNNLYVIKFLLEKGVDVNAKDYLGVYFSFIGHLYIMQLKMVT